MRGTGYAIGEILIFLAIATIIGFLLGWVVFYRRRPSAAGPAAASPQALEAVEKKTKSIQSQLDYVEKRTNAVLGALDRSSAVKERAKAEPVAKKPERAKAEDKKPEPAKTEDKKPEPAKAEDKPLEPTGDESLDRYLSKADERIHQLEDTLDRLSEKLSELED